MIRRRPGRRLWGYVIVVAGAGGTVTDLRLTAGAMHLEAGQLSAMIMKTMRQAVAGAVQQQAGIVDDAFGVNTSAQVREAGETKFGIGAPRSSTCGSTSRE